MKETNLYLNVASQIEGAQKLYNEQLYAADNIGPKNSDMDMSAEDLLAEYKKPIAFMQALTSKEIVASNEAIQYINKKFNNGIVNPDKIKNYSSFVSNAYNAFTAKSNKPSEFMAKTIQANHLLSVSNKGVGGSYMSYEANKKAYDKVKNGAGLITFDFETHAGLDKYGTQQFEMIYDFNFDVRDNPTSKEVTHNQGFIGIDETRAKELSKRYENFEDIGHLTGIDLVNAEQLAKIGNERTVLSKVDEKGNYKVTQSISNEDLQLTKENIMRGIKRSLKVGREQEATKDAKTGLMGWEEQMMDSMLKLQSGDYVGLAHNGARADIPWMNQFLSKQATGTFLNEFKKRGGKTTFNANNGNFFDTYALLRMAGRDSKFVSKLYGTTEGQEILQSGLTPLSQEALTKVLFGQSDVLKDLTAHTAEYDTAALFNIFMNGKTDDGQSVVEQALSLAKESSGGMHEITENSVLHAKGSLGGRNTKGLLGFKIDPVTGGLRTTDGYLVQDGKAIKSTSEFVLKQGMNYTVDGVRSLASASDEFTNGVLKNIGQVDSALGVNDLFMVALQPMVGQNAKENLAEESSLKSMQKSYIVGSVEEIQKLFADKFVHFADKDENGQLNPIEDGLKQLSRTNLHTGETVTPTAEEIISIGAKDFANDSLARSIRDNNFGKSMKYFDYLKILKVAEKQQDNNRTPYNERMKLAHLQIAKQAHAVAQAVAAGKPLTQELQSSLGAQAFKILGWEDPTLGHKTLDSRTMDNALAAANYFDDIGDAIAPIRQKIQDKTSNRDEQNYLFNSIMERAKQVAESKREANEKYKKLDTPYSAEYDYKLNQYEIESPSFIKKDKNRAQSKVGNDSDDLLRINLGDGADYGLINKVSKDLKPGNNNVAIKNRLLEVAGKAGVYESIVGESGQNEYTQGLTTQQIASEIIDVLKAKRQDNPMSGRINPVYKTDYLSGTELFSNEDVNKEINAEVDKILDNFKPGTVKNLNSIYKLGNDFEKGKFINTIVDQFMMTSFDEKKLRQFGYDDEQIKFLKSSYDIRRKDYKKYAETLFEGVSKTDSNVIFDPAKKELGLITNGNYKDLTGLVPRDMYADGIFYTQVGRNRVKNSLAISLGGKGEEAISASSAGLQSSLGSILDERGYSLSKAINNASRKGTDVEDQIDYWIKGINRELRTKPAVDNFNEKDVLTQFRLSEKAVIDALPKLTGLDGLDLDNKEEFNESISKKNFSFDHMTDVDRQMYGLNRDKILGYVAESSGNPLLQEMVKNRTNQLKSSGYERGYIQVGNIQMATEPYNSSIRGINQQNSFRAYDVALAKRVLSTPMEKIQDASGSLIDNGTSIGANLRTEQGNKMGHRLVDGTTKEMATAFTTLRATMNDEEFNKIISDNYDKTDSIARKRALNRLAVSGNLVEGGAIASGQLADAFIQEYDQQRISSERELFKIDDANVALEMKHIAPNFEVGDNGAQFSYGKGRAVNNGDTLFKETKYGGDISNVVAKSDGVLKFGYFSKANKTLVNQEDVAKFVQDEATKRNIKIQSLRDFMDIAKQIYDPNFYVDKLDLTTYRKLQENRAEKHMTNFAMFGLGESEIGPTKKLAEGEATGITAVLEKLGLGKFRGHVLTLDKIDELTDKNKFLGGALRQFSEHDKISGKDYREAIKAGGFKNPEEFKEAILNERYMPGRVLQELTGANMVLAGDDYSHANRMAPIARAVNQLQLLKEKELGNVEDAHKQAAQFVVDKLGNSFINNKQIGLSVNKNGNIEIAQSDFYRDDKIDAKQLEQSYNNAVKEIVGDNPDKLKKLAFENLTSNGTSAPNSYEAMVDATGMSGMGYVPASLKGLSERERNLIDSGNGIKVTDREINMMELQKIDDESLNKYKRLMAPYDGMFEKSFGHLIDQHDDGSFKIHDDVNGRSLLGDYTDEVRKIMFNKPGDHTIMDANGNYTGEVPEHLKESAKALHNASGSGVSMESAENLYSIASNTYAMKFNNGQAALKDLVASKYQFEIKNLGDLAMPSGGDGRAIIDNPDSMYGKNMIINLNDDPYITKDIIKNTKNGTGYLAIGNIPARTVGDEVLNADTHQAIRSIMNARDKLANSENYTGKEITRVKQDIVDNIDGLNQTLSKVVTGKKGLIADMSNVRMQQSTFGKASLMGDIGKIPEKDGLMSFLDDVKIDDVSLRDFHKKGVLMDFKVLSRDAFEKMGLFSEQYLKDTNMTAEEVEERLRKGVLGFSHRNPSVYEGTKRPTMLVLSDDVKGTQAVEYAAGAMTAKTDADGDNPGTELAAYTDKNGKRIDAVQYALMNEPNGGAAPAEVHRAFQNQKAAMYVNAVERNPYFAKKMNETISLVNKADEDLKTGRLGNYEGSLDVIMKDSGSDRFIRPDIATMPSGSERQALEKDFSYIHNQAVKLKAADLIDNGTAVDEAHSLAHKTLSESDDERHKYLTSAIQNEAEGDRAKFERAYEFDGRKDAYLATELSNVKRQAAGEINLPLYKVRRMREMAGSQLDSDDKRLLEHTLEASEEAFLSPKHNASKIIQNTLVMKDFNRALRSAQGVPVYGDEAGTEQLVNWFEKNLPGRFKTDKIYGEEFKDLSGEEQQAKQREMFQKAADSIQKLFTNTKNIKEYNTFLTSVGQYKNGTPDRDIQESLIAPKAREMKSTVYGALEDAHGEVSFKTVDVAIKNGPIYNDLYSDAEGIASSEYVPPTANTLRDTTKHFKEKTKSIFEKSNLTGKKIAIGALGLAGANLLTSFVGGNPSKPASTQAAETPYAGGYSIPPMSDGNLQLSQQSNNGYVININANTNKGRAHAEDAIKQAVGQTYNSSNVNISMNVRDDSGQVNDRDLTNMVSSLFA